MRGKRVSAVAELKCNTRRLNDTTNNGNAHAHAVLLSHCGDWSSMVGLFSRTSVTDLQNDTNDDDVTDAPLALQLHVHVRSYMYVNGRGTYTGYR